MNCKMLSLKSNRFPKCPRCRWRSSPSPRTNAIPSLPEPRRTTSSCRGMFCSPTSGMSKFPDDNVISGALLRKTNSSATDAQLQPFTPSPTTTQIVVRTSGTSTSSGWTRLTSRKLSWRTRLPLRRTVVTVAMPRNKTPDPLSSESSPERDDRQLQGQRSNFLRLQVIRISSPFFTQTLLYFTSLHYFNSNHSHIKLSKGFWGFWQSVPPVASWRPEMELVVNSNPVD